LTKGLYFPASFYIQALVDQKAILELMFASNDCSDKIEKLRQNDNKDKCNKDRNCCII
jgi:hypothetical protein